MASPFDDVTHIGSRRELLTDNALIDRMDGVELTLHRPVPRDVAIVHDRPWEGNVCFYHTVIRDDDVFRMYYRGAHYDDVDETRQHHGYRGWHPQDPGFRVGKDHRSRAHSRG